MGFHHFGVGSNKSQSVLFGGFTRNRRKTKHFGGPTRKHTHFQGLRSKKSQRGLTRVTGFPLQYNKKNTNEWLGNHFPYAPSCGSFGGVGHLDWRFGGSAGVSHSPSTKARDPLTSESKPRTRGTFPNLSGWNSDPSKNIVFFCLVRGKQREPQKSKTAKRGATSGEVSGVCSF